MLHYCTAFVVVFRENVLCVIFEHNKKQPKTDFFFFCASVTSVADRARGNRRKIPTHNRPHTKGVDPVWFKVKHGRQTNSIHHTVQFNSLFRHIVLQKANKIEKLPLRWWSGLSSSRNSI